MDAELKAKMLEYLGQLEQAAKAGGDFAAEQVPLAIQEYIRFSLVYHAVWLAVCVGLSLVPLYVAYRWHKVVPSLNDRYGKPICDDDKMFGRTIGWVIGGGVWALPFFIGIAGNLRPFLLAWLAPRVFIIEAIADLVK